MKMSRKIMSLLLAMVAFNYVFVQEITAVRAQPESQVLLGTGAFKQPLEWVSVYPEIEEDPSLAAVGMPHIRASVSISAPTHSMVMSPLLLYRPESSVISPDDLQGSLNDLRFLMLKDGSVNFSYQSRNADTMGHFWFIETQDLRGKTVVVYYHGSVPKKMTFTFARSHSSATVSSTVLMQSSRETQQVTFQIPNNRPFDEVNIFKFEINHKDKVAPQGNFTIEKVEILREEARNEQG